MEYRQLPFGYEPFEVYSKRFDRIRLTRENGVLLVRFHKDDAEFSWNPQTHREVSTLWNLIGMDPENKVIILTGTGESYCDRSDYGDALAMHDEWRALLGHAEGKKILTDFVEIEQPVIAALNGPVDIQSQIPLLADVVLAVPEATIGETHLGGHVLPGDGHHIVWPLLLGLNRARHALITQRTLSAEEALDLGLIGEIVPRDRLLDRAHEIAAQLIGYGDVTCRLIRPMFMQPVKKALLEGLSQGMLAEGYSISKVFHTAR